MVDETIVPMIEMFDINELNESHCRNCKAEFKNIGHPLKDGVTVRRICNCIIHVDQHNNGIITVRLPPDNRLTDEEAAAIRPNFK